MQGKPGDRVRQRTRTTKRVCVVALMNSPPRFVLLIDHQSVGNGSEDRVGLRGLRVIVINSKKERFWQGSENCESNAVIDYLVEVRLLTWPFVLVMYCCIQYIPAAFSPYIMHVSNCPVI